MSTRRHFLLIVPAGAALACAAARAQAPQGSPAMPRLSEADPHARAVGYVEDAAQLDRPQYPKYKSGEDCATCALYGAVAEPSWGSCTLFPRRVVAAKGWCDAFRRQRPTRP
jgi:hypothetical protein